MPRRSSAADNSDAIDDIAFVHSMRCARSYQTEKREGSVARRPYSSLTVAETGRTAPAGSAMMIECTDSTKNASIRRARCVIPCCDL